MDEEIQEGDEECIKKTNFLGYNICGHNKMVLITNFCNDLMDNNYNSDHYGNIWGFVGHSDITPLLRDYLKNPENGYIMVKSRLDEVDKDLQSNMFKFNSTSYIIKEVNAFETQKNIYDCKTQKKIQSYNDSFKITPYRNKDYQCIVCHEDHDIRKRVIEIFPESFSNFAEQFGLVYEKDKINGGMCVKEINLKIIDSEEDCLVE